MVFNRPIKIPYLFTEYILEKTNVTDISKESRLLDNEIIDPFKLLMDIIEIKLLNADSDMDSTN